MVLSICNKTLFSIFMHLKIILFIGTNVLEKKLIDVNSSRLIIRSYLKTYTLKTGKKAKYRN